MLQTWGHKSLPGLLPSLYSAKLLPHCLRKKTLHENGVSVFSVLILSLMNSVYALSCVMLVKKIMWSKERAFALSSYPLCETRGEMRKDKFVI